MEVRDRIEWVPHALEKSALKFMLLAGARVSEVVGKKYRNDDTTNYGIKGGNMDFGVFSIGDIEVEVCKFTLKTAKRNGLPRIMALPIHKEYEPWTEEIMERFVDAGNRFVYPIPRQRLNEVVQSAFHGLKYPIEEYKKSRRKRIPRHWKPFRLHALRHLRATDLIEFYGFTLEELRRFMGWTHSSTGVPAMIGRYTHLDWQSSFPKLLKRRY